MFRSVYTSLFTKQNNLAVFDYSTRKRVVKGIFVTRDRPFLFPVKCEIAIFFLVNRDFHSHREP